MNCDTLPKGKIEILFGDYFEINEPHYTRLDQLDRQHCYYLSNVYDKLDGIINNPAIDSIPIDVLESVLVVDLQKYDTMVDINGNVIDWSSKEQYYMNGEPLAEWYGLTPCKECDEALSLDSMMCRLSAINNVMFDDKLDIEASLIYNLIEIRPKSDKITVEYLRYFFWYPDREHCNQDGLQFRRDLHYLFCEELEYYTGNSRYVFTCDWLNSFYAIIDDFDTHEHLIEQHKQLQDQQARQYGAFYLKAAFGSPYYDNLKSLEKRVTHLLHKDSSKDSRDLSAFSGFVSELERFETGFNSLKASGEQHVSFLPFRAVEVILRAKLRCELGAEVKANDMMGTLIDYIREYWNDLTYHKYDYEDRNYLLSSLQSIARLRNEWAHCSKEYTILEAEKIMKRIYEVIKDIDKYLQ